MKVVICEPNKNARIAEIGSDVDDMQEAVGEHIGTMYPFYDEVVIVYNKKGKSIGYEPCRAIYDEDEGNMIDIIYGTFFICDCSGEYFGSLSDELANQYKEMFDKAETFVKVG